MVSSTRLSSVSAKAANQSSMRNVRGIGRLDGDEDAILQTFANQDTIFKKTFARTIVENVLSKFSWYYPKIKHRYMEEPPSLSKAWAYYEHVTLPRRFTDEAAVDTVMRRAEPGEHERETELYDAFCTPQSALIEWGTGIDLYFISLRFFSFIMLVAGCISILSMRFYESEEYNPKDPDLKERSKIGLKWKGTAVCTSKQWVVCRDCDELKWEADKTRIAFLEDGTMLALRNFCFGGNQGNGIPNYLVLMFLLISVGIFSYYLRLREIRYDEDNVTTTDYSVEITNPPPDAVDPDEWRDFFEQFADTEGQVTVITIALNNEKLFRRLITRRIFRNQLRLQLGKDVDLDDPDAVQLAVRQYMLDKKERELGCMGKCLEGCVFPFFRLFNMFLDADDLLEKLDTLTEEIKEFQKQKYDAIRVFVTFETEEGQRSALAALSTGKLYTATNNAANMAPSAVFKGKVLRAREPAEPDSVRWLDLSASQLRKSGMRIVTFIFTCVLISFAGYIIAKARNAAGPKLSGPLTSVFNSVIPNFIKILMIFEPHCSEGSFQTSLYLKITLARWVLSAILSQVITPFTSTLSSERTDLIPSIYGVLIAELWISPLLRVIDIVGNLKKHVLGPRAMTQEEMNLNFQGTPYNLGERYTDFTKVLFLCFFYAAVFPAGLFFGFLILTFQYVVDKYCLMRIWGWAPTIGSQLAVFSRRYFFTASLLAFALVSAYTMAQFPFDNLCVPVEPGTGFSGTYSNVVYEDNEGVINLVNGDGTVVVEEDTDYVFCSQSWRDYVGFPSPSTARLQTNDRRWVAQPDAMDLTWMTKSQERVAGIYGWTSVLLTLIVVTYFFFNSILTSIQAFFMGMYKPEGESQHIDFSSNPDIYAYVPQVKIDEFPFPFLACDIDEIDQGLIGWNDSSKSYDYYNLIFDVPHEGLRRKKMIHSNTRNTCMIAEQEEYEAETQKHSQARSSQHPAVYSIIKHYPTKWQLELSKKNK